MSLSAKERILKLRETEYKLQKLQNDLLNGNDNSLTLTNMNDFLKDHKELMALPGSTRDSLPFRFSFEAPQRYVEMKATQKLTLPPKIPTKSISRLKAYKDIDDSENASSSYKQGIAGHRSLALQSLLRELDRQTSKMAMAFPKIPKNTLLNKTPYLRGMEPQNSKRYVNSNNGTKMSTRQPSTKGFITNKPSGSQTKSWTKKPSTDNTQSKKVKLMWNNDLSETSSTATASELILGIDDDFKDENKSSVENLIPRHDSAELRESVAYALESSNLMGVILPSNSTHGKRGPSVWEGKTSSSSTVGAKPEVDENGNEISVKEAVHVLRKRKFPERKSPLPKILSPHERGLIGVEISNFETQCAFFYRDRNGNYNPHLHHSKTVTDSLKQGNKGRWNKYTKNYL